MIKAVIVAALSVVTLQACVVAPPQPVMVHQQPVMVQSAPVVVQQPQGIFLPPGVVYVAPTYPMPAVGFVWEFHQRYGWGWRHPQHGWHRGWR